MSKQQHNRKPPQGIQKVELSAGTIRGRDTVSPSDAELERADRELLSKITEEYSALSKTIQECWTRLQENIPSVEFLEQIELQLQRLNRELYLIYDRRVDNCLSPEHNLMEEQITSLNTKVSGLSGQNEDMTALAKLCRKSGSVYSVPKFDQESKELRIEIGDESLERSVKIQSPAPNDPANFFLKVASQLGLLTAFRLAGTNSSEELSVIVDSSETFEMLADSIRGSIRQKSTDFRSLYEMHAVLKGFKDQILADPALRTFSTEQSDKENNLVKVWSRAINDVYRACVLSTLSQRGGKYSGGRHRFDKQTIEISLLADKSLALAPHRIEFKFLDNLHKWKFIPVSIPGSIRSVSWNRPKLQDQKEAVAGSCLACSSPHDPTLSLEIMVAAFEKKQMRIAQTFRRPHYYAVLAEPEVRPRQLHFVGYGQLFFNRRPEHTYSKDNTPENYYLYKWVEFSKAT